MEWDLPQNYKSLSQPQRREVRLQYVEKQNGNCHHCGGSLERAPVMDRPINWRLFPRGNEFLKYPVHLHHNHKTGMTIGAVHAYCNAVLWQYHGE